MLKTLIKKQIMETLSFFLQGKGGKRRSTGALVAFAALVIYAIGAMAFVFWEMANMLCEPLVLAGFDWVYFALMGLMASGFGIIGGVFMTKSKLYEAKDNDLLLSMPIPAWVILFTRMFSIYLLTLLFEALVFTPALIQYYVAVGVSAGALFGGICVLLVMPLAALAICSALGLLLAWGTAKLPFKNLLTIIGFIAFFIAYMALYSKMQEAIAYLAGNGDGIAAVMKGALYPFSQLGRAATGDMVALALFLCMFVGVFAVAYLVISLTFLRIATMKYSERRVEYKEREQKKSSVVFALFKREGLRLIKSPMYMLNSTMGTLLMLVMGVMMAIKGDLLGLTEESLAAFGDLSDKMALLLALIVCFMASSNTVAACAVSLEGKNIDLIRSLPVSEWDILKAKLYLHIAVTTLPVTVCGVVMGCVSGLLWWEILLIAATGIISSLMFAGMDLAINLKFPNLQWTSEMAAIKQSMSVMFAMFGGWGVSLLPLGGYFLFGKYLPACLYLAIWLSLFVVAGIVITVWLYKKGTKIFQKLSA